jgi:NHLM bacteriocin system ABC transporter ATP-binding protein
MSAGADSIAWLKRHLGERVESVLVQGDRPLLLDDPSCAYVTLSEHHQLFCVGFDDGEAEGRREHLAVCEPGQLIFGLEPPSRRNSTALLLSGVSGSVVWRIPMAALLQLGSSEGGVRTLAMLFERWIALLIAALPPSQVPTRSRPLRTGESLTLLEEAPVAAPEGIVWVAPRLTPRSYRGIEIEALGSAASMWPLAPNAWLLSGPGELRGYSTEQLLRSSGRAAFALSFSAFVAAVVAARRAQLAQVRLRNDILSLDAESRATRRALSALAQVGSGGSLGGLPLMAADGDAYEVACRRIFRALELEAWPNVTRPRGSSLRDMHLALSTLTGVRTRPVLLGPELLRGDAGPLLAFEPDAPGADPEDASLHPLALLPAPGRGYVVFDPRTGASERVDAASIQRLHPRAHQFYRPFPSQPLTPWALLRFAARGVRADLLRVLVIGLAAGLIGTALPLLTGMVFDDIIPAAERRYLWQLMAALLAVFCGSFLFDLARGLLLVRAQTHMDAGVESGTWDRLLSLPLPFFREYSAGDLAARAEGIGAIRELLAQAGLSALLSSFFSIWNFVLLFLYDVRLALAASTLVGVAALLAGLATYVELRYQRALVAIDGRLGGLLLQLIGGIAKLRCSGSENRAFGVWARLFAERRDLELAAGKVGVRMSVFDAAYPLACAMVLYWIVVHGSSGLTTGQFLAFSAAFGVFLRAVLAMVQALLQVVRVVPIYERARPILNSALESRGASGVRVTLQGAIELSHVSFRYERSGPLVLDDVSLRVEPGEFVAIVGPSGSGKSTLLRILLGFDAPDEGAVFYDGQALVGMDVRKVRQQIGVVLQHSNVMAGDIYSNIVGSSGRSIDEAWLAARQAAFAADIEQMPMGMHTVLAQGGGTLSGGQRQRLLIARALASQPRLLFFDEATSALDNQTQAAVSESLDRLRVTRLVIAHRLSTIRHADRIVVLERGRVVQQGGFDSLLQQGGTFATLVRRQMM